LPYFGRNPEGGPTLEEFSLVGGNIKTEFGDRRIARLLLIENQNELEMLEEEEGDLKTPSGRGRTI
jgi:hypothetical protein